MLLYSISSSPTSIPFQPSDGTEVQNIFTTYSESDNEGNEMYFMENKVKIYFNIL